MKTITISTFIILLMAEPAQTSAQGYGLPAGALIVETQMVKPGRMLILWMLNPTRHPREMSPEDDPYTCPDVTRGHFYSGRTRVSLVNSRTRKIINTLSIKEDYWEEGKDSFDIPYKILKGSPYNKNIAGSYYQVRGVSRGQEGKPTIMLLKDYNGDGKAQEFALFDALACMGLQTTLIGYSERQDKVIQYLISLMVKDENNQTGMQTSHWVDYLFSLEPCGAGVWQYEIDYRGRGGSLNTYQVRYNPRKERFEGSYSWTAEKPERSPYFSSPRRCLTTH